jgi:hypothetical protein
MAKGRANPDLSTEFLIEKVDALVGLIKDNAEETKKNFEATDKKLTNIDQNVNKLNIKVGIQNGRVGKLEQLQMEDKKTTNGIVVAQLNCPAKKISEDIEKYKEELKPVHLVSTSWKMLLLIIIGVSFAFSFLPGIVTFLWEKVLNIFEIGL